MPTKRSRSPKRMAKPSRSPKRSVGSSTDARPTSYGAQPSDTSCGAQPSDLYEPELPAKLDRTMRNDLKDLKL